jgi:diguanylate cyclase (GGDEF)-like protein
MLVLAWQDITGLNMEDERADRQLLFIKRSIAFSEAKDSIRLEELAVEKFRRTGDLSDLESARKTMAVLEKMPSGEHPIPVLTEMRKELMSALSDAEVKLEACSKLPPAEQRAAALNIFEKSPLQNLVANDYKVLSDLQLRILERRRDNIVKLRYVSEPRLLDERRLAFGLANFTAIAALFAMVWYYIKQRDRAEAALKEAEQKLRTANLLLDEQAHVDPLTGVLNRRGLERDLSIEIRRAERNGHRLASLLIDCDDFKGINESAGHAGGDAVLAEIAQRVKLSMRVTDLVARIGGDEFIVIFLNESEEDAAQIAERVRNLIASKPITTGSASINATVSAALSELPVKDPTIENILALSRRALERSKHMGKNRVTRATLSGVTAPQTSS